jgi:CheY-like chemotaxis protein
LETALVVDDLETDAQLAAEILRRHGFEVEVVSNGAAALAAIERHRPDVVLLDVVMPAMGGMEVLDHIKANPQQAAIPVIMVTSKTGDDDLLAGYKFGADYFLVKPYTARQLLHAVGLVLGRDLAG